MLLLVVVAGWGVRSVDLLDAPQGVTEEDPARTAQRMELLAERLADRIAAQGRAGARR